MNATDTAPRTGFTQALHAEWIKLVTVRSTRWIMIATFVLGAGLTIVICWSQAETLASPDAQESPGSFITWGMMIAQITTVVLAAVVVTNEYGTGMIRSTLTAVPSRGRVLAAKAVLLAGLMFVLGTTTALVGYLGANPFLENEGIGLRLEGGVARSMYGNGLLLAGIALCTMAVGFILRNTAATISVVLAVMLVLGNMANLIPGTFGEWVVKLLPGNAGSSIASPVPFNPNLLDPWTGFAVFVAEAAALVVLAYVLLRRRDA
ncbi:ABC transporter permease [Aeromicrobium sp. CF3.5]|uniref:ABC transporter permease n=1 Tax=Aeromicrobium sp. CF3.5 TaxID=3373078 RepID=UPI003EE70647